MLFAYRNMTAAIDERLEREHGLALSSYEVLLLLSQAPDNSMRMGNLADQLLLSRSGLTRLVDRLAARDLVERHTCPERPPRHLRAVDRGRAEEVPRGPADEPRRDPRAVRQQARGPTTSRTSSAIWERIDAGDARARSDGLLDIRRWPTDSPARPLPTSSSTRTTRSTGYPGARRRGRRAHERDVPILLSIGYSACHWCHVMERESFTDAGDRRLHERALRADQGRSRGAPRRRRDLHGGPAGDDRPAAAGR